MDDPYALGEEKLIASAVEATGLSDLGGDDFRPGLRALIETYEINAFDERGRKRNHRRLVGLLVTPPLFRWLPRIERLQSKTNIKPVIYDEGSPIAHGTNRWSLAPAPPCCRIP